MLQQEVDHGHIVLKNRDLQRHQFDILTELDRNIQIQPALKHCLQLGNIVFINSGSRFREGLPAATLSCPCSLFLKLALDHPIQIPAGICNKILPFGQGMELLMLHVQIPQFLIPGAPQQRAAVSSRGCSTARSGSAPCSSKKWIMGTSF